jgi:hypothetical protein
MTVETPEDCPLGDDNMTNELIGEVVDPQGRINHFGITPPSVWTWTVPNPVPSLPPLPARALLDYEARIFSPSPPPPVPDSICPPVGDQVWDSDSVRKKTFAIFDSSGAATKPHWEVKEFLFAVYKNPDGSYRTFEPAGQLQSTNCSRPFLLPHPGFKDSTLVAIVHVHPFEPGQKVFCTNGDTGIYDNRRLNGLSGGDGDLLSQHIIPIIERAGMSPRAIGVYIIDKDRIWLNPPTDTPSTRFDSTRYVPRRPAACRWA